MLTYSQSTGIMTLPGIPSTSLGYSGHGLGLNNPAMQSVHCVGPIPQGLWSIGEAVNDPKLGPVAIPLTPQPGTETFGRSGFYVHGDEIEHPGEHLASDGCIILPRDVRELIATCPSLGEYYIQVIP